MVIVYQAVAYLPVDNFFFGAHRLEAPLLPILLICLAPRLAVAKPPRRPSFAAADFFGVFVFFINFYPCCELPPTDGLG